MPQPDGAATRTGDSCASSGALNRQWQQPQHHLLRHTDELFRLLVENAHDYAIFLLDVHGFIVSWNMGAERILGFREEESLGQSGAIIFTPEDRAAGIFELEMRTAQEQGRADDKRWHLKKDGSRFFADGVVAPLYDEQGQLHGFGKILRDATERVATQQQRAQQTQLLRLSLDAIVMMDSEGKVTEWNPAAEQIFGYSPAEALGTEMASLIIPPALQERHRQGLAHYLNSGEGPILNQRLEVTAVRKNGLEFPVELVITPVKMDPLSGSPRFLGFIRDITERKQAERALRRQAELIDLAHDAIFGTDLQDRILLWNRGAQKQYGWSPDEALGKRAEELLGTEFPLPLEQILDVVREQGLWEGDLVHRRRDGIRLVVAARWALQRDEEGQPLAVLRVNHDITAERQATEKQAAHAAEQERIAAALQGSLLLVPPPDAFPGLRVETIYQSASKDTLIGGDFCDVFAIAEDLVALVVGDVTGKGLEAAIYTAEIKFVLRAFLREFTSPPVALGRLNKFIVDSERMNQGRTRSSAYVAIACVLVNSVTGEVQCCSAGIEPPFVLRAATGAADEIGLGGALLGAEPEARYEMQSLYLTTGDLLVMATDGITEARRGRKFFGLEGLIEAVRETSIVLPSLGEAGRAVVERAKAFAGGKQQDDICLLLARRDE